MVNQDKDVQDAATADAKGKFKRVMIEESSDEEGEKAGSNARTFARAVKDGEKYSKDLKLKEKVQA